MNAVAQSDLADAAERLGGEVHGGQIRCPGPNHSASDRSLTVFFDPAAPDGFRVNSFCGDDFAACRDHVRATLGMAPFDPSDGSQADPHWFLSKMERKARLSASVAQASKPAETTGPGGRAQATAHVAAEYIYRTEAGDPFLKVTRWRPKRFTQSRWTGAAWVPGKPDGLKLPYRLPEMLRTPDATIYICEGEKDADRLGSAGFVATTASEGAGKWTSDLTPWFAGRDICILPDNDGPGQKHAEQVARALSGIAGEVRILLLPGLLEKGDVSDWLDAGGTASELQALTRATTIWKPFAGAEAEASFVTASELMARPLKPRAFLAGEAIPVGQVTELRGDGKTGKSTLGIQLAVSVVTGMNWLSMRVKKGPAIYLASEDDEDEIHRRLDAIAVHYKVQPDALADLHIWPLASEDPALVTNEQGRLKPTAKWDALVVKIEAVQPAVILLDSRADVFAGEEMNRLQVRTFIGMLRALAVRTGAAVVVLAHPSLSGMTNGTGNSGSTHWTNAVRSVLYLRRPNDDGDAPTDPDARLLEFGPSNYAGGGAVPIRLRWSVGAFVVEDDGRPPPVSAREAENEAERIFVLLLARVQARGTRVRDSSGHGYAPKEFEAEPEAREAGIRSRGFKAAMNRLLDKRVIRVVEEGPPSKRSRYLALV